MLKVKFNFEKRPYPLSQIEPIKRCFKYLENHKIQIVENHHDLLIAHHATITEIIKPTIIIERTDSCIVYDKSVRNFIEKNKVLAIWKTTSSNPITLNNCNYSRYHFKLMNETSNLGIDLEKPNHITALSKIKCMIPLCTQSLFKDIKSANLETKKPIDVIYLVRPWIESPLIQWHRNLIQHSFAHTHTTIVGDTVPRKEWVQLLLKSKICISPWGWGEMCYRDFDAIYAGCVLLKPNSNHVISMPNIYLPDCYIPFKLDCSDLQEKINTILQNWSSFTNQREATKDKLLYSWNDEMMSKQLAEEITRLYETNCVYKTFY